jgi:sugar phosphate isomerase/epimerase
MGIEPRMAVHACGTRPANTILEDIAQIGQVADAIGLYEGKFGDASDEQILDALGEAGLEASYCLGNVHTILPLPGVFKAHLRGGTEPDPKRRTEAIISSIPRMAKFKPAALIVGPGVTGIPGEPAGPIDAVYEGLTEIIQAASEYDLPITFEYLSPRFGATFQTMPEIVQFVEQFDYPKLGILWDLWHCWYEDTAHDDLRKYGKHLNGVHVTDVKAKEVSHRDRALPGEGMGLMPEFLATLLEIGYDGFYELEVFSDDGTFGFVAEPSLWALDPEEYLQRSRQTFDDSLAKAREILAARQVGEPA